MTGAKKYSVVREKLSEWYDENKRDYPWRKTTNMYRILITEILLQKTIASNVNNIYDEFFKKYKDFSAIHGASINSLQSDIKSLGLSNKRSKILKDLSKLVLTEYKGRIPEDSGDLKKVTGIGDYVCNAYACVALNKRTFFSDVNIKRIIERVFEAPDLKKEKDFVKKKLNELLPSTDCKHFYWGLLDYGSKICTKRTPKCDVCQIAKNCATFSKI